MSFIQDAWDSLRGKTASEDIKESSQLAVDAQNRALDYLMESEEIPSQFRDLALQRLGGMFGLEGGTGEALGTFDQEAAIQRAMESPLYQSIMGTQQAGEEAILRNAAATGGLRSGNVQQALAQQNQQLQRDALTQAYNQQVEQDRYGTALNLQGLGALTGTASLTPQIANTMSNIGMTQAQAGTAAAQAQQSGLGSLLNLGVLAFSDIRLKQNIQHHGVKNGVNYYSWDWNEAAKELGLYGSSVGVMAHEINEDALVLDDSGYLVVDYSRVQ